jgi:hypothetical protein
MSAQDFVKELGTNLSDLGWTVNFSEEHSEYGYSLTSFQAVSVNLWDYLSASAFKADGDTKWKFLGARRDAVLCKAQTAKTYSKARILIEVYGRQQKTTG